MQMSLFLQALQVEAQPCQPPPSCLNWSGLTKAWYAARTALRKACTNAQVLQKALDWSV